MFNHNEILKEVLGKDVPSASSSDITRRKYLGKIHERRGRNIVAYYSGHLHKRGVSGTEIDDEDKNAFLNAVHGLDPKKGLDLILHTPGGEVEATESIGNYLREVFGTNIEVFVPLIAMSAGTMIACASKKIHMGKQSSIGPIDPQTDGGISAGYLLDDFNRAADEIEKDSSKALLWQPIMGQIHPSLITECEQWIKLSEEIVTKWLETGMFSGDNEKGMAGKVVNQLSDYQKMKSHGRQIGITKAKEIGLKIEDLEADKELEGLVLSMHSSFMHSFVYSMCFKIVENHNGVATIYSARPQPIQLQNG